MQIPICTEGLSLCKHLHRRVFGTGSPLRAVRADRVSLLLHTQSLTWKKSAITQPRGKSEFPDKIMPN